nr:MAG TPA: Putative tail fiber protein fold, Tail fiber, receptor [Caudoviricetes sp.]
MSILKAILHRWNKNTKTYDTIHPETETSQITDFNSAVDGKISTHNNSNTAHSALFGKKVNVAGDAMTGNLNLKGAALQFTRTDDNTTNGKDYLFDPINISGSDGNRYGFMRVIKKSSGSRQLQLGNVDNNNNPSGSISINTDNNGTAINVQGITPSDGANDTSLTTAEWVNKKLGNYEKTGSLANDIITKLAQTTVMSIISTLQTGSWFGQLLKLVLNASGVKYLIGTNGYICFGSFFGGLIIQWGSVGKEGSPVSFTFPVAFTSSNYMAVGSDYNPDNDGCILSFYNRNINGCEITGRRISADKSKIQVYGNCIFIGH